MADIETFGADRDDIESSRFKKYKAKKGDTDRVGIVYTDPKKMFKGTKVHFKDRIFVCKSTKDHKEICCTHSYDGNKPKYRIGCVIVIYDLVQGKDKKVKLKDYELIPWVFGEQMYSKLNTADKEFPLDKHDIKLTCTNDEYQNIDIQSCKDSIWSSNPALKEKILKEAESLMDDIASNLASDLSLSEIRELLGIDSPGSEDAAADVDLETVVDSL